MKLLRFVALLLLLSSCPPPSPVVIPSDRELPPVPGHPGWHMISEGHLLDLADRESRWQAELTRWRLTSTAAR